ncbi:hypothetical protein D7V97_13865 [Corallococcus sp. CA053C]|uniref:hypothetical protein n=1 Tax=Corallococcus sp. CA053C TaxID=2316732 RepID=UPI000EA095F5|nr:hypothetical protein [Corallococcus sp. CA053C]RKH10382.1 hypothetical protein D7V97_13865 [Corallococcus sp. CA053C]
MEDQIQHALGFNGIPLLTGIEGLARLRCIDAVGVDAESFAVLVPEHASEDKGPFTVFRYRAEVGKPLSYERVTDAGLIARVLKVSRA